MARRRPDFIAYSVTGAGTRTRFRKVGVAHWNPDREYVTVVLDAASRRLVLSATSTATRRDGGEGSR